MYLLLGHFLYNTCVFFVKTIRRLLWQRSTSSVDFQEETGHQGLRNICAFRYFRSPGGMKVESDSDMFVADHSDLLDKGLSSEEIRKIYVGSTIDAFSTKIKSSIKKCNQSQCKFLIN